MVKRKKRKSMRERVRADAQMQDQKGSSKYNLPKDAEFFTPEVGVMNLEIIPYEVTQANNPTCESGDLNYRRTVYVHYNVGPEEVAIICPKTIGKRCPICEEAARLAKDWKENEDTVHALRPRKKDIFNIRDMENSDEILFWEVSYYNFGNLLDEEITAAPEDDIILGISDLEDRPMLEVRFKEESFMKNKFIQASKINATKADDLDESILERVVDLDKCLNILPYAEIEKMFMGIEEDMCSEQQESEPEKEEEEDLPFDPEPEEEEAAKEDEPKKRTKRKKRKAKKDELTCPCDHTFGTDCNEYNDCAECPDDIWEPCSAKKDELEA